MKKEVKIINQDYMGRGVGKLDEKVIFINNALPNEEGIVQIEEMKKNYLVGTMITVNKLSLERRKVICPYYDKCGGCHLLHQSYKSQLEFKQEKVNEAIKRIGKFNDFIVNPIVSDKEFNYRNKAVFHISNNQIGFYSSKTNNIVSMDKCLLCDNRINDIFGILKEYLLNNKISSTEVMIRTSYDSIMIYFNDIYDENLSKVLEKKLNTTKHIILWNNNDYIIQKISDFKFYNSAKAFFQINPTVVEKLYNYIVELSTLDKNDIVLDLYCGTGTITCFLAKCVKKCIGIEIVPEAIEDAKKNVILNNITNVEFIQGNVTEKINDISDKITTVVLDPPRKGSDQKTLDIIIKYNPKKIIYVSCDPSTLARDLRYLCDHDYVMNSVTPFDMFPNTYHVECVCVLNRR